MTYFLTWLTVFLFLAMAGILWEAWKAAKAIAKDTRKSLDRWG